jgi:hypothetical protein
MDLNTGKIRELSDEDRKSLQERLMEIQMDDATPKQKKEMHVSLHDHRSKLGKQLTKARSEAGLTKNRYRKLKRQGKLR